MLLLVVISISTRSPSCLYSGVDSVFIVKRYYLTLKGYIATFHEFLSIAIKTTYPSCGNYTSKT